jgi:hypothetical protein
MSRPEHTAPPELVIFSLIKSTFKFLTEHFYFSTTTKKKRLNIQTSKQITSLNIFAFAILF